MSVQLRKQEISSQLHKKIDEYLLRNGEEATEKDKKEFVSTLLSGRSVDLSGVTAIRGFIYQYYIGVNYLIEMLFSKDAWWDKVIFELLDDIALYGEKNIRFVQVKTKRDSNTVNPITLGELHERRKKKGSWLDKLFLLNLHVFDLRNNDVVTSDDSFFDNYNLQFELATNSQYNKDIAVYEKSDTFQGVIEESEYNKLIEKMNRDNLEWKVPYQGKEFFFTKESYSTQEKDINWYLSRFRVKRYGDISALREEIIYKIMSNTAGNRDTFHSYKAGMILDMILLELIKKTCQDSENVSLDTFVFDKESFSLQFEGCSERADHSATESATRDNIHEKFTSCFEAIKNEFQNSDWKPNLKQELLLTLTNLQSQLSNSIQSNEDPFAYHRFLHRIFTLNNFTTRFAIDDEDKVRVKNALKTYIFCLVFYNKVEYASPESDLLLKRVYDANQEMKVFSIFNVRKNMDIDWAKKMVRSAARECTALEVYNYDLYCFLADVKERKQKERERSRKKMDSIHASVVDVARDDSDPLEMQDILEGKEITRLLENIKFGPIKLVEEYFNYLEEENPPDNSFQEKEVIDEWSKELIDGELK